MLISAQTEENEQAIKRKGAVLNLTFSVVSTQREDCLKY